MLLGEYPTQNSAAEITFKFLTHGHLSSVAGDVPPASRPVSPQQHRDYINLYINL